MRSLPAALIIGLVLTTIETRRPDNEVDSVEVPDVSEEESDPVRKLFDDMDENDDGWLTLTEVQDFWRKNGDDRNHEGYFNEADENKDGKLFYPEFLKAIERPRPDSSKRPQRKLFRSRGFPSDDSASNEVPDDSEKEWGVMRPLKKLFNMMDADSDGWLSRSELESFDDKGDFYADFNMADQNNDGKIDFQEFVRAVKKSKPDFYKKPQRKQFKSRGLGEDESESIEDSKELWEVETQLRELFNKMDADQNGSLSRSELESFWNRKGDKGDQSADFNRADQNNDGKIDFQEFEDAVERIHPDI